MASVPLMRPRFEERSPAMSPMFVWGTVTWMSTIGSRTIGAALPIASTNAFFPAATNATSLESTEWCLPSWTVTRTSWIGYPATAPVASTWRTPFSTAGMNWFGITPPTTASTNSKPVPRASGSTFR